MTDPQIPLSVFNRYTYLNILPSLHPCCPWLLQLLPPGTWPADQTTGQQMGNQLSVLPVSKYILYTINTLTQAIFPLNESWIWRAGAVRNLKLHVSEAHQNSFRSCAAPVPL